jgi:hypothetical protein
MTMRVTRASKEEADQIRYLPTVRQDYSAEFPDRLPDACVLLIICDTWGSEYFTPGGETELIKPPGFRAAYIFESVN